MRNFKIKVSALMLPSLRYLEASEDDEIQGNIVQEHKVPSRPDLCQMKDQSLKMFA